MAKNIQSYRTQIDMIDQQLLKLLNERAHCALAIGEIKKETATPVFHPERENQVIQSLVVANQGPLRNASIAAIWQEIMSACRSLEEPIKVAFLGPVGTFTEEAALSYFGSGVEFDPCPQIDDIFKSVTNGHSRFGVVPIENSTEGSVARSLDLLQQSSLKIIGEHSLAVKHLLLGQTTDLQKIKVVYAHPQALAQCQDWLRAYLPHALRQAVSSNAEGARLASEDPLAVAIAGKRAATIYKLQELAHGIQDVSNNRTRFVVLARQEELEAPVTDGHASCTSIVVSVPNRSGAVHDLLVPLKKYGVTLTRLESRPARSGQWEYFFYMDLVGHISQPAIAQALEEVHQMCTFYKVLGSYFVRKEIA